METKNSQTTTSTDVDVEVDDEMTCLNLQTSRLMPQSVATSEPCTPRERQGVNHNNNSQIVLSSKSDSVLFKLFYVVFNLFSPFLCIALATLYWKTERTCSLGSIPYLLAIGGTLNLLRGILVLTLRCSNTTENEISEPSSRNNLHCSAMKVITMFLKYMFYMFSLV